MRRTLSRIGAVRHYAYQLKLDPITTTTARNDATFHLIG